MKLQFRLEISGWDICVCKFLLSFSSVFLNKNKKYMACITLEKQQKLMTMYHEEERRPEKFVSREV
jgi:hypothetical protein